MRFLGLLFVFICGLCCVISSSGEAESRRAQWNVSISRAHVGVWFDSSIIFSSEEEEEEEEGNVYSGQEMAVMCQVVSNRFGVLAISSAPYVDKVSFKRNGSTEEILVPSIIAKQNKDNKPGGVGEETQVVISFSNEETQGVATTLAQAANDIHPGTVTTLMYIPDKDPHYWITNFGKEDDSGGGGGGAGGRGSYKFGILTGLQNCAKWSGTFNLLMNKHVDKVDQVVLAVDTHFPSLTLVGNPGRYSLQKAFRLILGLLEGCERRIRGLNLNRSSTSGIELVLAVYCNPDSWPVEEAGRKVVACWEMMSAWAAEEQEGRDRKVLMFQAFDSPYSSSEVDLEGLGIIEFSWGWWRLRSEHGGGGGVRSEADFVEKATEEDQNWKAEEEEELVDFDELNDVEAWLCRNQKLMENNRTVLILISVILVILAVVLVMLCGLSGSLLCSWCSRRRVPRESTPK